MKKFILKYKRFAIIICLLLLWVQFEFHSCSKNAEKVAIKLPQIMIENLKKGASKDTISHN